MSAAPLRGILVVAAVILGMVVLAKAFPESGSVADAPPPAAGSPAGQTGQPATTQSPSPQEAGGTETTSTGEPKRVKNVVIQILNGTNESGLAAETAEKLQKFGYDINGVANAQRQYRTTTLFYRKDSQAHAQQMVADFFPGARLEPVKNNLQPKLQVTVVIGKDYVSQ